MNRIMLEIPPFDASAAQYALQLMDRMTVPAAEVLPFLMLRKSLEALITPVKEEDQNGV